VTYLLLTLQGHSVLAFISSTPSKGFQITYRNITLHAISRSEEKPYLYCQLDDNPDATEEEADAQDYEPQIRDLKIVPEDPSSCTLFSSYRPLIELNDLPSFLVEPMFEALSICAALHPDRNTEGEGMEGDEDDDDAFVDVGSGGFETFTGAPGEELSEVGRVRSNFVNDNRFAPY
jgi:nucleotide-sensitive chloride channel 1A